jgi:eukaryotic-like serine/threonine-protein kinase
MGSRATCSWFGSGSAAEPIALSFQVGDRLGNNYRLCGVLGRGGMSQVFEAEDLVLHRRAAIKVPLDPAIGDEPLRREAQALAAVRHPGLPCIYSLDAHEGHPYLAMERLYGVTLEDHLLAQDLPGHQLPVDESVALLLVLADILVAVHDAGLAHRDLKPANVMLCPRQRVVLLDFGIMLPEVEARQPNRCGTPRYMAPELITSTVALGKAHLLDTYALGAMAFEMLAGRTPFDSSNVVALFEDHLGSEPPALRELRPDVPVKLAELIHACLAKHPEDRPSTDAIVWELRGVARAGQRHPSPTPTPFWLPR